MALIKQIYIYTCLTIIVLGTLWSAYMIAVDGVLINIPLKFKTNVVITDKKVYNKGDNISIKWEYCKGTPKPADISVNLVDGIVYMLPMIQSTRGVGCYDNYNTVAVVPYSLPVGKYHLTANIHYSLNSLKSIDYKVISNTFEVK